MSFHESALLLLIVHLVFDGDCRVHLGECTVLLIVRQLSFANVLDGGSGEIRADVRSDLVEIVIGKHHFATNMAFHDLLLRDTRYSLIVGIILAVKNAGKMKLVL